MWYLVCALIAALVGAGIVGYRSINEDFDSEDALIAFFQVVFGAVVWPAAIFWLIGRKLARRAEAKKQRPVKR
jgi:hypothetical protein